MIYQVRFTQTSLRQFDKMDKPVQQRIISKLDSIIQDPLTSVKRLRGINLYSLRIGDYRVIFSIESKTLLIIVLEIGYRSKVYRRY